ncbi:MAG: hypothetical protein K0V04_22550, partial [Deltaproteobacteria bacterium]|nr:hypothetical protein [Deltaproteobacteria bacterium]
MRLPKTTALALLLTSSLGLNACLNETPSAASDSACTADCSSDGTGDDPSASDTNADPDGGSGGTDPADPMGAGLPCDIDDILLTHCAQCHDEPPLFGAPMALRAHSDFQMPADSDVTRSVYEVAIERLSDPVSPMPPGGDIDPDDRDALLAWLEAGAPEDPDAQCDGTGPEPGDPVGPEALPCEVTHTFTAHADASTEPFHVPAQGADNLYQCFTFQSPLTEPTQATAWAPIIDDERVIHHWILYRSPTPQVDGGVGPCNMPSDALFVAGWAPGGGNFLMPPDVGLELGGPDDHYILQVHYHNTANHDDALDASGVAFCTAEQPRPLTAGIITLGSVFLSIPPGAQGHDEAGTCPSWVTGFLPEPLTVIASFPHMHELGRSFRTEILRGGDEANVDLLTDVPIYEFENQEFYVNDPPVQIMPGDAIRTTCTYDNPYAFPVGFGEGT